MSTPTILPSSTKLADLARTPGVRQVYWVHKGKTRTISLNNSGVKRR